MYQDLLLKPSELVLYRRSEEGGLGLFHVKLRSLALLIRTFMGTAANPHFPHSLYHKVLFGYHVLQDPTLPNPGLPPYYDQELFNTIWHYKDNSPMDICTMSIK